MNLIMFPPVGNRSVSGVGRAHVSVSKNCSCHGISPDCIVCFPVYADLKEFD